MQLQKGFIFKKERKKERKKKIGMKKKMFKVQWIT